MKKVGIFLVLSSISLVAQQQEQKQIINLRKTVTITLEQKQTDIDVERKTKATRTLSPSQITKFVHPPVKQPLALVHKTTADLSEAIKKVNPTRVQELIAQGAALNYQDKNGGSTFMMLAIKNLDKYRKKTSSEEFIKSVDIIKLLFKYEKKIDFSISNLNNQDALDLAKEYDMPHLAATIAFILCMNSIRNTDYKLHSRLE